MSGAMRGSYLYEMLVGPAPGPALLSIHQRHSQPIKMCPGVQTISDGQTLVNTMGQEKVPSPSLQQKRIPFSFTFVNLHKIQGV